MKIEHGFRDWKSHLRLRGALKAQNVAYVKGLLSVLALVSWCVGLFGLQWLERRFWARAACWGRPGFCKVALDLLTATPASSRLGRRSKPGCARCRLPLGSATAATAPGSIKLENCSHWRRDATLHEDRGKLASKPAALVMAVLNSAITALLDRLRMHNLRAAMRTFAAHPEQALPLIRSTP
jgi:hypothetical protein